MSESKLATQYESLALEGEQLSDLPRNDPKAIQWIQKCTSFIQAGTRERQDWVYFQRSNFPHGMVAFLHSLAAKEHDKSSSQSAARHAAGNTTINVTQTQTLVSSIHNQLSLQIVLNIESSPLSETEKKEATELYEAVDSEVKKEKPDWTKITGLLKKSFDFGLKIAPDLVKLADAYYRASGGH